MNVEEFREYCLSLKGVEEKMPFVNVADRYSRDVLCFYVGDKWFCFVNVEVFDFCCIKCDPVESGELQACYMGVKRDVSDEMVRKLVKKSYDMVVKCLNRKERERLL